MSKNYINGSETLAEIWKSKLSYCALFEPIPTDILERVLQCDFDRTVEAASELLGAGLERLMTLDHVPPHLITRRALKTLYRPFSVYLDGKEIVRSQWEGDAETGHWSEEQGRLTNKLALQIDKMANRLSLKGNWIGYSYRDEMQAEALVRACEKALKFDDIKSANPFAYLTTIINNELTRTLTTNKKQQNIRDEMLWWSGQSPSLGFEPSGSTKTGRKPGWSKAA